MEEKSKSELRQRERVGLVRHVRVSCVQNNDGLMQVLLNVINSALALT